MAALYVWELFTSLEAYSYIIMHRDNKLNKNPPNC